jgi:hypothetical protein
MHLRRIFINAAYFNKSIDNSVLTNLLKLASVMPAHFSEMKLLA